MSIKIYNTLTRKKEALETLQPGKISMYVCGPTVYDKAHVGHAMSALVFDIVRRYLEYRDYEVRHVTNYTDVDDKIIQRAAVEGVDPIQIAQRYIDEFDQHLKDLNILIASEYPRATEEINRIVEAVADLVEKGYAYPLNGDVYYRVEKFPEYGKLSGRKIEDMEAGFRIEVDDRKEHPMDLSHLGDQVDIHGGGNDLIFPHHENEIAQSEAMHGKQFATYWMHNGMMQLSGAAMSKSTGNLVTIDNFLEHYEANVLRMMILNSSYRGPITFNEETIEHSLKALKRLRSALKPALPKKGWKGDLKKGISLVKESFLKAMDDDFNTAGALGFIFDFVKEINHARDEGADQESLIAAQAVLNELTGVFGLELDIVVSKEVDLSVNEEVFRELRSYFTKLDDTEAIDILKSEIYSADVAPETDIQSIMPDFDSIDNNAIINIAIKLRDRSRNNKDWATSDHIRDFLSSNGIVVEDSDQGTTWYIK
jgi:cysteinyl-tRNA synthetase